jgi:hypothetical protein
MRMMMFGFSGIITFLWLLMGSVLMPAVAAMPTHMHPDKKQEYENPKPIC